MTVEERLERIEKLLLDLLDKQAAVVNPDFIGPGPTFVNGAYINLAEPIRKDWQPSPDAVAATGPSNYGVDPSNGGGRSDEPRRSPAGYPMHYAPGFFGMRGARSVLFAGVTFENDAAVEAYKQRIAQPSKV